MASNNPLSSQGVVALPSAGVPWWSVPTLRPASGEEVAPRFSAVSYNPWAYTLQPQRPPADALRAPQPPSFSSGMQEPFNRGLMVAPHTCPTLLEIKLELCLFSRASHRLRHYCVFFFPHCALNSQRFYAIHGILDASQKLSSRASRGGPPPPPPEGATRFLVPVIHSLRAFTDSQEAEEDEERLLPQGQQAGGLEAAAVPLEAGGRRQPGQSTKTGRADASSVGGVPAENKRYVLSKTTHAAEKDSKELEVSESAEWFDRELRRNLQKERELVAAKVRLIEEAWIEHMRSKKELELHQQTCKRVVGRCHRNSLMKRVAAGLRLDPVVSEAFKHANADSLIQAQKTEKDSNVQRRTSSQKAAPRIKEDLKRQKEEREKQEFLERFAAMMIQAAYRGFVVRSSIAFRVPVAPCTTHSEKVKCGASCKRQRWWSRINALSEQSYWELILDLKVQSLASSLKAPQAEALLAAEAAAVAKKLEEAREDTRRGTPFDPATARVVEARLIRKSSIKKESISEDSLKAEGRRDASGSPSESRGARKQEDAPRAAGLQHEVSSKLLSVSKPRAVCVHHGLLAASEEKLDGLASMPEGFARQSLASGYEVTPADVIAFRASALAVRSLGPHYVRGGVRPQDSLKKAAPPRSKQLPQLPPPVKAKTGKPLSKQQQSKEAAAASPSHYSGKIVARQPHSLLVPEIHAESGETKTVGSKSLQQKAARGGFLAQREMAEAMRQAVGGPGKSLFSQEPSKSNAGEAQDRRQSVKQTGVPAWRPSSDSASHIRRASQPSDRLLKVPAGGAPKHQAADSSSEASTITGREPRASVDGDLPTIVVGGGADEDLKAAAASPAIRAGQSEAAARSKQELLTLGERADAQREKRLSERRSGASSRQAFTGQQTPRPEAAAAAPVADAHQAPGPVDLEAVKQALLRVKALESEASEAKQPPSHDLDETAHAEASGVPDLAENRNGQQMADDGREKEALALVRSRQKQELLMLGERAAAQRDKRLNESRSGAVTRRSLVSQQTLQEEATPADVETPTRQLEPKVTRQQKPPVDETTELEASSQLVQAAVLLHTQENVAEATSIATDSAEKAREGAEASEAAKAALANIRSRQKDLLMAVGGRAAAQRGQRLSERRSGAATRLASTRQQTPRPEAAGEAPASRELTTGPVDLEAVREVLQKMEAAEREAPKQIGLASPPHVELPASEDISGLPHAAREEADTRGAATEADESALANVRARQKELLLTVGERVAVSRGKRLGERRSDSTTKRGSTGIKTPEGGGLEKAGGAAARLSEGVDLVAVNQALLRQEEAEKEAQQQAQRLPADSKAPASEGFPDRAASDGAHTEQAVLDQHAEQEARAHLRARQQGLLLALGERADAQREKRLSQYRSAAATRRSSPSQQTPSEKAEGGDAASAERSSGPSAIEDVGQGLVKHEAAEREASQPMQAVPASTEEGLAEVDSVPLGPAEKASEEARVDESLKAALSNIFSRQRDLLVAVGERAAALRGQRLNERRSGAATRLASTSQQTPLPEAAGEASASGKLTTGPVDLEAVREALLKQQVSEGEGSQPQQPVTKAAAVGDADDGHTSKEDEADPADGRNQQVPNNLDVHLEQAATDTSFCAGALQQTGTQQASPPAIQEASGRQLVLDVDVSSSPDRPLQSSTGDHTFRGKRGAKLLDLAAVSAALADQSSGLPGEGASEGGGGLRPSHKPSRTPVWGTGSISQLASDQRSLASAGSPADIHSAWSLSAADTDQERQQLKPSQKRIQRGDPGNGEWISHQKNVVSAMHRHAAARVIQHAWRRRRLRGLFSKVGELRRRREERASRSQTPLRVASFIERAREIISRTQQLSPRSDAADSALGVHHQMRETEAPPQFVPVVEGREEAPTAVVLFNGGRRKSSNLGGRFSGERLLRSRGTSREEAKQQSAESLRGSSDAGSQGTAQYEGLPAILLRPASRGPSYPTDSSSESGWSSSESDSEQEADVSREATDASSDSDSDDFNLRQRLRRIVREGLDSKMRSTVEDSSVLLPRAKRAGRQGSLVNGTSERQDLAAVKSSSRLSERKQALSAAALQRQRFYGGLQDSADTSREGRTEQKTKGVRSSKSSQKGKPPRRESFLSPDWQASNFKRTKQEQEAAADSADDRLWEGSSSLGDRSERDCVEEPRLESQTSSETLHSAAEATGRRRAPQEAPASGKRTSGSPGGEAQAGQLPAGKATPCGQCQNCRASQCFCGLSAGQAGFEDKTSKADPLPRSPRKDSPRAFRGPPLLALNSKSVAGKRRP
ncbi:hypothetical protein Efla_002023 [Eimeria flavescens]